jgi:YHS domain-containing protein
MYVRFPWRLSGAVIVALVSTSYVRSADAQTPAPAADQHQHGQEAQAPGDQPAGHDMAAMAREGSGTAWLPDATPMYAIHAQKGVWQVMTHESVFVQFLHESGSRGADQTGSINWFMAMANRPVGAGRLSLRGMVSAEPSTIRGCGYPDLLATGERCKGEQIHDRQHQHDLVMEASAAYDAPLKGSVRWQIYGAPAGEPALGPVAYPHRPSAMPNPLAPIAHHWLDSTHITFGVVTGALYANRWKAEVSAFNGREPDEDRTNFDMAALDSISGRLSFLPTQNLALQVSTGRLTEAEPSEGAGPRIDVTRVTASATYHRAMGEGSVWASTVAWGRNSEPDHTSHALLFESNVTLDDRDSWFGRFEVAGKSAHDLDVPGDDSFTVSKLQGGYVRYIGAWNGVKPGVGVSVSGGFVPDSLEAVYGSRANVGFGVFVTLRAPIMAHAVLAPGVAGAAAAPGDHTQHAGAPAAEDQSQHAGAAPAEDHSQHTAAPAAQDRSERPGAPAQPRVPAAASEEGARLPVLPVERVIDPRCAATIDLVNAPRATYQNKAYYFCSTADRDAFVRDPEAYLNRQAR